MIEIYRESENGPGFVQVTSFKTIEPHAGCEQDFSTNLKGRIS
jgi:hypothetical protein